MKNLGFVLVLSLTAPSVPLHPQGSGTSGDSGEEVHPDPAEVHQERVEVGKDRLCCHCGLCPLLVTVRLRHTDFLGRVRLISWMKMFTL